LTVSAVFASQNLKQEQMTKLADNNPQGTANIADNRVLN